MDRNYNPPREDEIEISIFGPGIGECIVLHLGNSEWIIIDSCVERISGKPIALKYLEHLAIDPRVAVKCIIASHWHDDHINGVYEVLKRCTNAEFVCSNVLISEEFLKLISLYRKDTNLSGSGLDEMCQIFGELKNRSSGARSPIGVPIWACENKLLMRKTGPIKAEVFALSPSNGAYSLALIEVGQLIPRGDFSKRRIIAQQPNHVSVAIWVKVEEINFLLGSDLENLVDCSLGWQAVILSNRRPAGRALVVKVPHHGSENAYCEEMWREMVVPSDPIALLTPFSAGKKPLPTQNGIGKIKQHTNEIFITGPIKKPTLKLDPAVAKTIKEMVLDRRTLDGPMGHVRVRIPLGSDPTPHIEMFEGASKL